MIGPAVACNTSNITGFRGRCKGRIASIHRVAEKGCSRKPDFRCTEFSETQFVPLLILGNPIYRGNSMRSALGLCTNAQTTFRCTGCSETQLIPGPNHLCPYCAVPLSHFVFLVVNS